MGKNFDWIEKTLLIKCHGWATCREVYEPIDEMALTFFEYGALRKAKKNFTFEDLAFFRNRGWKIRYFGMESKKLPCLGAEYLGETTLKENKK